MKKIMSALFICLSLTACKKEKQVAFAPPEKTSLAQLAEKSMAAKGDWTKDISLYVGPMMACVKTAPVQVKYIFKADAFETPTVTLILIKGENDKFYACGLEGNNPTPRYELIKIKPDDKMARFYPGNLPKPDSCLNNSRILDDSGSTAGWLSKITC